MHSLLWGPMLSQGLTPMRPTWWGGHVHQRLPARIPASQEIPSALSSKQKLDFRTALSAWRTTEESQREKKKNRPTAWHCAKHSAAQQMMHHKHRTSNKNSKGPKETENNSGSRWGPRCGEPLRQPLDKAGPLLSQQAMASHIHSSKVLYLFIWNCVTLYE